MHCSNGDGVSPKRIRTEYVDMNVDLVNDRQHLITELRQVLFAR